MPIVNVFWILFECCSSCKKHFYCPSGQLLHKSGKGQDHTHGQPGNRGTAWCCIVLYNDTQENDFGILSCTDKTSHRSFEQLHMGMSYHKADVGDHMADSCKHDSMTHLCFLFFFLGGVSTSSAGTGAIILDSFTLNSYTCLHVLVPISLAIAQKLS